MKKLYKNNKAITLIALVIIIVILVILGGVVIGLALSNDGLLNKAIQATDEIKKAKAQEDFEILIANYIAERENNGTQLEDYLKANNIEYSVDGEGNIVLESGEFEVTVDPYSLNMDPIEKEVDSAKVNTEPKVAETGGELKAVFKIGNNVDVGHSKYLFREKSDTAVTESDITTPIATQTASISPISGYRVASADENTQTIKIDLDTEEKIGTYEVFLLVVYNDHNKAHKIKRTEVVIGTPVTSVTISQQNIEYNGQDITLTATVKPDNATKKDIIWESEDTSIARVNHNGVVTGVSLGTTKIYAISTDGSGIKGECTVEVTSIPVQSIALNKSTLSIKKDDNETLTATVSPSNAVNQNVTWSSSNTSVATVNQSGQVTAVAVGSATITAKSAENNNISASATVNVYVWNKDKASNAFAYQGESDSAFTTRVRRMFTEGSTRMDDPGFYSNKWCPPPVWFQVDKGSPISITKVSLYASYRRGEEPIKGFYIEGSNDVDFNTSTEIYRGTYTLTGQNQNFTFTSKGSFRYYRLYVTEWHPYNQLTAQNIIYCYLKTS